MFWLAKLFYELQQKLPPCQLCFCNKEVNDEWIDVRAIKDIEKHCNRPWPAWTLARVISSHLIQHINASYLRFIVILRSFWQLLFVALINFYMFVRWTQNANDFLFLALYTVKLQSDGEEKISESSNSLSFIKDSVFGTSRRCFLIVPIRWLFSSSSILLLTLG